MAAALKLKDRLLKTDILQEMQESKKKTATVLSLLRSTQGRLSNEQIAQLNDIAYKAVQTKSGLQKKIDERALKNREHYQNLEKQVEEATKKMNLPKIREEYKSIGDAIGSCPLSVLDVFDAIEQGTCMCLGLEVERSENCIADPTLLKIKKIIPTFMTAEAFIDSSTFNLQQDSMATGGFTQNGQQQQQARNDEGEAIGLAMGLGRENINGVLPLYLFPEHWEIARRRAPPIYGLLCTLDAMGFASNQ